MRQFYEVSKNKVYKLRHYLLTLAFLLGFIVDNFTLNRVDQLLDNAILFSYVILAMSSMLLLYAGVADKLPDQFGAKVRTYTPFVIQYAFGGLLSGMLIFYGRSGTLYDSWPFLLLILVVIYGNETIRDRSERLVFNIAILFVGLIAYVVLIIPVFTGYMGPWVFLGSGIVALTLMYWFVMLLRKIVPNFIALQQRKIILSIGLIYVSFNFLYFANIIPPIPLSLKEVGIYHSVVKFEDNRYQLTYEKPKWWQFYRNSDSTFHYTAGDNIYCFASVFAPTRISTDIYHLWERYDDATSEWKEHGRFSYPIEGGRDNGYRGYTQIKNYSEGLWRCTVETERGQVVGRESFMIESGPGRELVTRIE